jgi:hypothetical protein
MSWGAGLAASLLVVLPRPAAWIVGLAAFLVRGGIVLFLLPIVVVPSPVGLANILGPTITTFWLGGMSLGFAALVTAIFVAFFLWLVVGGWVAAVTERDLIELVVADEDLGAGGTIPRPSPERRRGRIWRILLLRFAAYVPLAIALGYGSLRLVQATYRELTQPTDLVTPIAWRVVTSVPAAVFLIVATWVLGETLGSLGARRLVVWGQSLDRAFAGAWADLMRRPLSTLGTFGLPLIVTAVLVTPILLAAGVAWDFLRRELSGAGVDDGIILLLTMLTFVAIWSTGLLVAGLASAWRSAAFTVDAVRQRGTFGALRHGSTGEWNRPNASGSLERPA